MSETEKPPDAAAPATDPGPKSKQAPTEYVVLAKVDDDGWREIGSFKAVGSNAAIKAHLATGPSGAYTALVAVPARSWQPVKPKTETVTKTSLEPLT